MELEKQSANQLPSEKKSIVLNGHKPIVNPLYDDDEFDVDTETPFLSALSTVEVAKVDKNADDDIGNTATNLQTVEDGEILENSNDETGFSDQKNHRSVSRSLKNEETAKSNNSKWSSRKSSNYSPERRSSGARDRGKRERSGSYGDRDQNKKRMTEAAKMRDSMIRDKHETKREKRDRRDSRDCKGDSQIRADSNLDRRQAKPWEVNAAPSTPSKNIRYTKCQPPIAYADNGRYPQYGSETSSTSLGARLDAEGEKSRKSESKSKEMSSKRSGLRPKSRTKSKSPATKAQKNPTVKKSSDSFANAVPSDDGRDERRHRSESKQSDRLEWKDVQRKSTAIIDSPTTIIDENHPHSYEEFHTIPLNLNISKQKHHFQIEKSPEKPSPLKCQLEEVPTDEKSRTNETNMAGDEMAKSARSTKPKNEPNITVYYDEYDEFMLCVEDDVKKEPNEGADGNADTPMKATEARTEDVKVDIQSIELEPPSLSDVCDRIPKIEMVPAPEPNLSSAKCATEANEAKTKIKNESVLPSAEERHVDVRTNSKSKAPSPSAKVRAEQLTDESATKIEKSNADVCGESNRKSCEKLNVSKRKRSTSSSSSSSSTSSDSSSSSSSSSDDDSSSSSSTDSNSSSSNDDSETSSNSSSSGKQSRTSVKKHIAAVSPATQPSVAADAEQEAKMQEKMFEEFTTKTLKSYGYNLEEELLSGTTDLLNEVNKFKQNLKLRMATQKRATKSNENDQVPEKNTVADETANKDPNRPSISLSLNKATIVPVPAASIFDSEMEQGRDKASSKSNNTSSGSAIEADTSDDSKRSSHRHRSDARKSHGDDERSRRHSSERHRKRSDDDRKKSTTHRPRKSSRHRSRSPHSSKYAASRNRDRRSSSRSRRVSRERHDSNDRGSKRSRNRVERFDRNERQSSFTPPPRLQRRSTSRNRSLASPIESRRRSLSPGRPYKPNMSPPASWHRYERRSPFPTCNCSPNRCICMHRNGEQLSRNAATASRGPRTPPNTPPSENNALYERYGDRSDPRPYAEHRSSPDVNHFSGCEPNVNIRLPPPPYHHSPIIGPPSATDVDYASGYNHSPQYVQNHFPFPSAPIHPPPLNPGMNHSHVPVLGSGDGYYYQTIFPPHPMIPSIEQQHAMPSHRSFAPYASQPPYGNSPINSMAMKPPPMRKPERKSTIVQKGNVLEIVPGLEMQQDGVNAATSESSVEPIPKVETPPMSDEQILQMERLKRKKERQQKRLAKEKRKEFVINEIKRLSQHFIVGTDGKMIKAGELLKTSSFGKYVNGSPKPNAAIDSNDTATSPPPVQLYEYNANAKAGKSIIISGDTSNRESVKHRKKVVFADGIVPGEGTSASENNSDGDEFSTKKAIARSKNKKRNARNTAGSATAHNVNSVIDTENSDEKKLALKLDAIGRNEEADENFVPGPPDGSPTPHLKQPRLKCPEKFIVDSFIYFHYNQFEHSMYISQFPNPTHTAPPPKPMQSAIPTVITTQASYAYNKHKNQMDSPKDVKVVSRTPLSVQKSFHSTESNLIVLQSNSPTTNYSTNEAAANNYGSSPMQYISHGHQQASPQQPIPTHYTSQSIQTYRTHTPIITHQSYQMATPTQNYMQSPQIANNIYPTSI